MMKAQQLQSDEIGDGGDDEVDVLLTSANLSICVDGVMIVCRRG